MRTKIAVGFMVVVVATVLAGCDQASKTSNPAAVTPATLEVAGPNPSVSAKMICGEAKEDIAAKVGVDTARPLAPKWANHLYSCPRRRRSRRSMTLSVKEMSSVAETCSASLLLCTERATPVPGGESLELAESARYLESVSKQLPEFRTRGQAER